MSEITSAEEIDGEIVVIKKTGILRSYVVEVWSSDNDGLLAHTTVKGLLMDKEYPVAPIEMDMVDEMMESYEYEVIEDER